MQQVVTLWRLFIYDSTQLPIRWHKHPHRVHKVGARLGVSWLGSAVPTCVALLKNDVLLALDTPDYPITNQFAVAFFLFCVVWLAALWPIVVSVEGSLYKHLVLGSGSGFASSETILLAFNSVQPDS